MADSIQKLYVRLGLDVTTLSSDFISAEATINQNMAKLAREMKLIKIRTEVDTANLDPVKDKLKIIEAQEKSLNQQLSIQKTRVELASNAYKDLVQRKGATSTAAQQAEAAFRREELAAKKLENQLKRLQVELKAVNDANKLAGKTGNQSTPLQSYQAFSGELSSVTGKITDFLAGLGSLDKTLVNTLTMWDMAAASWQKGALILTSLVTIPVSAANSMLSYAQAAIKAGEATFRFSGRIGGTLKEAGDIKKIFALAGEDAEAAINTLQRLDKAVLSAGQSGNLTTTILDHFNVQLKDGTGKLKSYIEQLEELAKGYKAAEAEGRLMEYITMLGPRGSLFPAMLGDWDRFKKMMADDIATTGLIDPTVAHDITINQAALNYNLGQIGKSISAAFMPAVQEFLPAFIELTKEVVKAIGTMKDGITEASRSIGKDLGQILKTFTYTIKGIIEVMNMWDNSLLQVSWNGLFNEDFSSGQLKKIEDSVVKSKFEELQQWAENQDEAPLPKWLKNKEFARQLSEYDFDEFNAVFKSLAVFSELMEDLHLPLDDFNKELFDLDFFDDVIDQTKQAVTKNRELRHLQEQWLNEEYAGRTFIAGLMDRLQNLLPINDLLHDDDSNKKALFDQLMKDEDAKQAWEEWYKKQLAENDAEERNRILAEHRNSDLLKMYDTVNRQDELLYAIAKERMRIKEQIKKTADAGGYERDWASKLERELPKYDPNMKMIMPEIPVEDFEEQARRIKEYKNSLQRSAKDMLDVERIFIQLNGTQKELELFDLEQWKIEQLNQETLSDEEIIAVHELYWAKRAQIDDKYIKQERDNYQKLYDEIYQLTHTQLEAALHQIERTAEEARKVEGADISLINAKEEIQKFNTLKQAAQEFYNYLNSVYESSLQNRLNQIEQEKQAWIKKGLDEVAATKAAEAQKLEARRNAALEILKSQREEFEVWQQEGERGLLDFLREKNGITDDDLRISPALFEGFQKAREDMMKMLLPQFAPDYLRNQVDVVEINGEKIEIPRFSLGQAINLDDLQTGAWKTDTGTMNVSAQAVTIDGEHFSIGQLMNLPDSAQYAKEYLKDINKPWYLQPTGEGDVPSSQGDIGSSYQSLFGDISDQSRSTATALHEFEVEIRQIRDKLAAQGQSFDEADIAQAVQRTLDNLNQQLSKGIESVNIAGFDKKLVQLDQVLSSLPDTADTRNLKQQLAELGEAFKSLAKTIDASKIAEQWKALSDAQRDAILRIQEREQGYTTNPKHLQNMSLQDNVPLQNLPESIPLELPDKNDLVLHLEDTLAEREEERPVVAGIKELPVVQLDDAALNANLQTLTQVIKDKTFVTPPDNNQTDVNNKPLIPQEDLPQPNLPQKDFGVDVPSFEEFTNAVRDFQSLGEKLKPLADLSIPQTVTVTPPADIVTPLTKSDLEGTLTSVLSAQQLVPLSEDDDSKKPFTDDSSKIEEILQSVLQQAEEIKTILSAIQQKEEEKKEKTPPEQEKESPSVAKDFSFPENNGGGEVVIELSSIKELLTQYLPNVIKADQIDQIVALIKSSFADNDDKLQLRGDHQPENFVDKDIIHTDLNSLKETISQILQSNSIELEKVTQILTSIEAQISSFSIQQQQDTNNPEKIVPEINSISFDVAVEKVVDQIKQLQVSLREQQKTSAEPTVNVEEIKLPSDFFTSITDLIQHLSLNSETLNSFSEKLDKLGLSLDKLDESKKDDKQLLAKEDETDSDNDFHVSKITETITNASNSITLKLDEIKNSIVNQTSEDSALQKGTADLSSPQVTINPDSLYPLITNLSQALNDTINQAISNTAKEISSILTSSLTDILSEINVSNPTTLDLANIDILKVFEAKLDEIISLLSQQQQQQQTSLDFSPLGSDENETNNGTNNEEIISTIESSTQALLSKLNQLETLLGNNNLELLNELKQISSNLVATKKDESKEETISVQEILSPISLSFDKVNNNLETLINQVQQAVESIKTIKLETEGSQQIVPTPAPSSPNSLNDNVFITNALGNGLLLPIQSAIESFKTSVEEQLKAEREVGQQTNALIQGAIDLLTKQDASKPADENLNPEIAIDPAGIDVDISAIYQFNQNLGLTTQSLQAFKDAIDQLNFTRLMQQSAAATSSSSNIDLTNQLDHSTFLRSISTNVLNTNQSLNDLVSKVEAIVTSCNSLAQKDSAEKPNLTNNINVNVDNLVTENNSGMMWLAEKVGDIILPQLIQAVGGDSNSY